MQVKISNCQFDNTYVLCIYQNCNAKSFLKIDKEILTDNITYINNLVGEVLNIMYQVCTLRDKGMYKCGVRK